MHRLLIVLLLMCASLASGQPWEWELTAPNWRNPTGFPELSPDFPTIVADVNGDGLADIVQCGVYIYVALQHEDGTWSENSYLGGPDLPSQYMVTAQNLDEVPGEELVFAPLEAPDSLRCFQLNRWDGPWRWDERSDLLAGRIPAVTWFVRAMLWGNFDLDADEEVAAIGQGDTFADVLALYDRTAPGEPWQLMTYFDLPFLMRNFYSGDFENDGDEDIAVEVVGVDGIEGTMFIENSQFGLRWHEPLETLKGPGGGDLDGDEGWEFLYYDVCAVPPFISVDGPFIAHLISFDQLEYERDLRAFEHVVGTLEGPDSSFVACTNSFYCFNPWGGNNMSRTDFRDSRADLRPLPMFGFDGYAIHSTSRGDINGDGLQDLLGLYTNNQGVSWLSPRWILLLNTGDELVDAFELQQDVDFVIGSVNFPDEYYSPALGDVDGDGRAELLVYPRGVPMPEVIQIFRIEQLAPNEIITRASDLESGLPPGVQSFEAADLDGDGVVELFPVIDGAREAYYFRYGRWESYESILPQGLGEIRGFADWDHNGTLDVFTDEGIHLNLSPSEAEEPQGPLPTSFALSVFPNPFNAQTTISFALPRAGIVSLKVFDVLGRDVATLLDEQMTAGTHSVNYYASGLSSGVYFLQLDANGLLTTHKLLLLK